MRKKNRKRKPKPKPYKTNSRLIKSLLILQGYSIKNLARLWGITPEYLSYIINGDRTGYKYRKKLAEILGRPEEELFPKED